MRGRRLVRLVVLIVGSATGLVVLARSTSGFLALAVLFFGIGLTWPALLLAARWTSLPTGSHPDAIWSGSFIQVIGRRTTGSDGAFVVDHDGVRLLVSGAPAVHYPPDCDIAVAGSSKFGRYVTRQVRLEQEGNPVVLNVSGLSDVLPSLQAALGAAAVQEVAVTTPRLGGRVL